MSKKSIFFVIVGFLLLIIAIVAVKASQIFTLIETGKAVQEPPVTVSSVEVVSYEWESTLTAIGSLEAAKGLEITADLSGRITNILFDAGSEVKAGDLLVEQDTSTEKAQLRAAQSAARLAKSNFDRVEQLYRRQVATQSEFDSVKNTYQSALADADNIKAAIEKKSIRAPFDGRLGIRLVNLGQSISAGDPVVSLQATNQMFVNFFLPQQELSDLQTGLTVRLTSDAVPEKVFLGTINAINPEIDTATRSVEIQAILANPEGELLPGMFASLEVVLPNPGDVLIIPITSVKYATYGASVFIIEPKSENEKGTDKTEAVEKTAVAKSSDDETEQAQVLVSRQQFVRLGDTRGDYVVVKKGVSEGDVIASAGVFKLRNGGPVVINNDVVPEFSINPTVSDQ